MYNFVLVFSGLGKTRTRSLFDNVVDLDVGFFRYLLNPRNYQSDYSENLRFTFALFLQEIPGSTVVLTNEFDVFDFSSEEITSRNPVMLLPSKADKFHYMERLLAREDSCETEAGKDALYHGWDVILQEGKSFASSNSIPVVEVPYGTPIDEILGLKNE